MDKIAELERRLTLLENMINLMLKDKGSGGYSERNSKSRYQKYVVTVENEEIINCVVLDIENQMSSPEDVLLDIHPNVTYMKFANNSNYEVVVITSEFYSRWKYSHRNFYTVKYDRLVEELKKGGVING